MEPFDAAVVTPVLRQVKTSPRPAGSFRTECSFQGTPPAQQILVMVRQWVDTAPPSLGPSFNHLHRSRCLQGLKQSLPRQTWPCRRRGGRGLGEQSPLSSSSSTFLSPYLFGSIFTGGFSNDLALIFLEHLPPASCHLPSPSPNTHTLQGHTFQADLELWSPDYNLR